ncbi:Uncharacterised protein [Klebsiella pneumoniae]|nr:Uncharacterised protein [Klebsiella pneumoniae]VVL03747.1 Uncharacterised protein [Klebsiella pneumoniae]
MKVTETRLDTLIDNLNNLICEDDLLTRHERKTLVRAVAAIGAMKARVSMKKPTVPRYGIPHPCSTVNLLVQRKRVPDLHPGH